MTVQSAFDDVASHYPPGRKRRARVFDREHLGKIRNALMEASYTHPQIHTVWDALIRRLEVTPGALEAGAYTRPLFGST